MSEKEEINFDTWGDQEKNPKENQKSDTMSDTPTKAESDTKNKPSLPTIPKLKVKKIHKKSDMVSDSKPANGSDTLTKVSDIAQLFKMSFKNEFWAWVKKLDSIDPRYFEQRAVINQVKNIKFGKTSTYNRVLELWELFLESKGLI